MGVRAALLVLAVHLIVLPGFRPASAEEPPPKRHEFESKHMGTTFRIVLYSPDGAKAKEAAKAGFALVAELDAALSDYKPVSELNRLCKAFATAVGDPVPVGDDLFAVLARAEEMSKASDGAFDVTVGPVVQLWRLARRTQRLPDPEEFAVARAKVGWRKVQLDPAKKAVRLLTPGMQLDLGGIAKGYAADRVLDLLRERFGIARALVAGSGDIACGDAPPGRAAWDVDVAPIAAGQKPRRLRLANAAVSTSGDLEQFVEIGGVRYSHVLDPKTGLGLTGRRSVTVVARRGVTADSATKAVSVLPLNAGFALIDALDGAAAYVVVLDAAGKPVVRASKRFAGFAERE